MEFFYIFASFTLLGIFAYGLQIWSVRQTLQTKYKADKSHKAFDYYPPVSILKPLKGLDDKLFDNLESFCTLDYPEYEVIFSLQDYNDPAYKVARKIKDKYHEKNISIVTEKCAVGLNPKVNNLITAYNVSRYDYVLISDSNIMVDKNYLKEIIRHMEDQDVGLVSNIIKGVGGRTIGSIFENLHLNSFIIGSVCFLDRFLKMPCVIGKSMLMRKEDLEAIGGFKAVKDVLAEDYVIGEKIHRMGKKVVLSNYAIYNVNEYWGISRFLNRHTRWGKLRWRLGGIKYISELISNPVFMSFVAVLASEASKITISFALFIAFIKVLGDLYLRRIISSDSSPFVYLLSPVKDLIIGFIWFVPILNNRVMWRGNKYLIGRDSMLYPYPETGFWAWRYRIAHAIKTKIV